MPFLLLLNIYIACLHIFQRLYFQIYRLATIVICIVKQNKLHMFAFFNLDIHINFEFILSVKTQKGKKMKRRSKRLNDDTRDLQGQFKRKCGSSVHYMYGDEEESLINLNSKKNIQFAQYDELIANKIITRDTNFICKMCSIHKVSDVTVLENANDCDDENESVNTDSSLAEEDELTVKCYEIAQELNIALKEDAHQLYLQKDNVQYIENLNKYNSSEWLSQRPQELLTLICSLCKVDFNTSGKKKLNLVAKIIELIYCCRNSKLVLPNHFIESLLSYSLTNCKSYSNFLASRTPGGSYSYLVSWLKKQASEPLKFPDGLCKAIFDNNQKIGKTYLITGDNIVPTSVMTSHLWITLDPESTVQKNESFKPTNWMWNDVKQETENELLTILTTPGEAFRRSRNSFIKSCIKSVWQEHNKKATDFIDEYLKEKKEYESAKKCIECGCEADLTYRICRSCGGKVIKEAVELPSLSKDNQFSPYKCFDEFKASLPNIKCNAGEPDFINPNSYEAIVQVIQNIGSRAGIKQYGGEREWLFVECDGLPYNILREILTHVWRCLECQSCYFGLETFESHRCFILRNAAPVHEFGWLVPVIGLLHLEMNACRSFMKLNWEVFTGTLGSELGFKSPKAQQYLQKGSDHHKTWHFLEILYCSLSMELVVPYIETCLTTKIEPSTNGYWDWCEKVQDPNYIYAQHSVFTHLHALMMLRSGKQLFFIQK